VIALFTLAIALPALALGDLKTLLALLFKQKRALTQMVMHQDCTQIKQFLFSSHFDRIYPMYYCYTVGCPSFPQFGFYHLIILSLNCISGVMVSVLASSEVDHGITFGLFMASSFQFNLSRIVEQELSTLF
jgi:hypothetical protein